MFHWMNIQNNISPIVTQQENFRSTKWYTVEPGLEVPLTKWPMYLKIWNMKMKK